MFSMCDRVLDAILTQKSYELIDSYLWGIASQREELQHKIKMELILWDLH